jgi:hypothetical protein
MARERWRKMSPSWLRDDGQVAQSQRRNAVTDIGFLGGLPALATIAECVVVRSIRSILKKNLAPGRGQARQPEIAAQHLQQFDSTFDLLELRQVRIVRPVGIAYHYVSHAQRGYQARDDPYGPADLEFAIQQVAAQ